MPHSSAVLQLSAKPVNRTTADLGESPLWDANAGLLRWLDVTGCRLFALTSNGHESVHEISETVTAIELGPDGELLAVTRTGFGTLDPDTGRVHERARVLHDDAISMNDGAIDANGVCWAGSAVRDGSQRGALYRFDGTEVTTQLTQLGMSNGLDWSPDGDVLYHVDTGAGTLTAWDVTPGALDTGRTLCSLPADVGLPDGLTVDAEGDIWLAVWGRSEVWRIDARTGETTGVVHVPTSYPTSCAFGGDSLSTLFITTAAHENAAGGGLLYAVDVPVRGREPHRFSRGLR